VLVSREVSAKKHKKGLTSKKTKRGPRRIVIAPSLAHGIAALLVSVAIRSGTCDAADTWGGSLGLTSDYFVRGITRTNDQGALQIDFHFSNSAGFLAGAFASNTQIDPHASRDVEVNGFLGYAWTVTGDWRAKILATYYAYPWNQAGTQYNYEDLDLDLAYDGWLHFGLEYSPNAPRYLRDPYDSLRGVSEKSAEVSLQRQVLGRLSATAGIGYSSLDGPDSGGYGYWSIGAAYDLRSVSLALSYVDTTAEAKSLFYNAAASGRWMGTVIWRF
jgi:uncharacterized protein (TIGR02001 family)